MALRGGRDGHGCSCPHTDGPSAPAKPPRAPQGATDLAAERNPCVDNVSAGCCMSTPWKHNSAVRQLAELLQVTSFTFACRSAALVKT